ncbi:MAG: MmcQ/YjbR family DNA-binding protein [Candidatus Alcyoniella australis]|nr:MmcQ/YjbR family DNA-binding protein [Candidatus Alcyoniella australis]
MKLDALRKYFAAKAGSEETFPFDETTLVLKVGNKMYGLVGLEGDPLRVNLKCDPDLAELLRARYESVIPGYHMNKRHWNSVILDGSIPRKELREMIDHSYDLVFRSLRKADRERIIND